MSKHNYESGNELAAGKKNLYKAADKAGDSVESAYSEIRSKINSDYPEIDDIRGDLSSLKSDVVKLTRHVHSDGGRQVKEFASRQVDAARDTGRHAFEAVEKRIKEKPAQTIAMAFFTGVAVSFLLSRR